MKKVTLNFREVAVDGLPEKSMMCVVLTSFDGVTYEHETYPFSLVHGAFNTLDCQPTDATRINSVTHWAPNDEFNAAMKKGRTVKQHA